MNSNLDLSGALIAHNNVNVYGIINQYTLSLEDGYKVNYENDQVTIASLQSQVTTLQVSVNTANASLSTLANGIQTTVAKTGLPIAQLGQTKVATVSASPSNNGNWQWIAGSGADSNPYFRIFNPTTQSERFDKDGYFLIRYLPELTRLPSKSRHAPSAAERKLCDYPTPIVDHKVARQRALDAFKNTLEVA